MSEFDLINREILKGKTGVEEVSDIYKMYTIASDHWSDKRAGMTLHPRPRTLPIHTMGPSINEELHNYYDHYFDGIENDWKKDKPKVRWSAFQLGDREAIDVVEYADFPFPGTRPQFPFNAYDKKEEITPGKIVRFEVGVWAMGVDFDAGESISVRVGGKYPSITEFQAWSKSRPEEEKNRGRHKIHIGTIHSSSIILPFVPL